MHRGGMVHRFHVGFGSETWNGFVLHKLETYVEGDTSECIRRRGETTLSLVDDKEGIYIETDDCESGGGRDDDDYMNSSSVRRSINTGTWDYHDPFMARRWANRNSCYNIP
ncbi:hypothetical protein F2Q69_00055420 [Brassica cretica]|uniref:Uncharacterized protein n=1 Tax=Brassica cretica TaxID=69181 RepID=A0A8S9MWM3_BRACR|nr:hypothetical protein F2Q69_00055420 [Brassica cretica]